jgi:hypothetical protein
MLCPGTSSLSTSARDPHLQALCRRIVGGLQALQLLAKQLGVREVPRLSQFLRRVLRL